MGLKYRKIQSANSLLTEFVTLDEAPAERILDYARRYGRFGFCEHGDPSHRLLSKGCNVALCAISYPPGVQEALEWWRTLARHARGLLNAAAQLSKGKVDDQLLAQLDPQLCFSARHLKEARRYPSAFIAYGMELWLRYFQVRPRMSYKQERKRFEVRISGVPPLPGALAVQLMLTITRSAGVAVCSSCGRAFAPSRRPNSNRNAYCKACGRRAAWREPQARRRLNNSAAKKRQM
jgi:predicted RNA-binding Zn-ribbon protein involved in translation (DUF1610 family)